ncbi:putative ABC transporter ATP-binding protein [Planctomycetaceae bacterium]|nr:putative ABC transporter ATP-binding protein [Planctomycetaceae bacterium]
MPDEPQLLDPVDHPMRRLFAYMRPMRGRVLFSISSSATNKVLDLAPPILVAWLTDVIVGTPPSWISFIGDKFAQIVFVAVLTVLIFGLESVFQWMYQYGFMTLAQNVQHKLRLDAYSRMQDREIQFFEEHRLGKTLAMLNDDVNQLERFLNSAMSEIVQLIVLILFSVVVLFAVSWPMAIVCLVPIPVIVWGSLKFSLAMEPRYRVVRAAVGDLASRLENNIAGITVIKSFTAESYESSRVEEASAAYRAANHQAIRLSAVFVPIIRMAIAIGFAGVIILGGWLVMRGEVTAGNLVLFSMLIQRLLWPLTRLGTTFDDYQRAKVSATRVFSLLATPSRIADPSQPQELARARGDVAFENVTFAYRTGSAVISGLTFKVNAGEMIGIAGPTGAGKSTLIKLLLRLYDVNSGSVKLDGIDLRELRQFDVRRQIALVSQDVYLFHGTIFENIAYGSSFEVRDSRSGEAFTNLETRNSNLEQRVIAASKAAELHEFVTTLPQGYDSIVGERGIKLSGGQRQRLSIARALLKDAPILVLDEATSSVDTETEREIQQNLAKITQGRTALVIAHRLSTIRNAHRILVLKDGALAEEGTHEELVSKGGVYADLWAVQSGSIGQELNVP